MEAVKQLAKCLRCGYEWESRKPHPKACPDCKRRDWDKPKVVDDNDSKAELSVK